MNKSVHTHDTHYYDAKTKSTGINTETPTPTHTTTSYTASFFAWRCSWCKHSEVHNCKECGCEHYKCNKLNIVVKGDFFCKDYAGKESRIEYPIYPPVEPQTPIYPAEPTYWPVWSETTDSSGNKIKYKNGCVRT